MHPLQGAPPRRQSDGRCPGAGVPRSLLRRLRVEIEKLRAWKEKVVGKLSGGVAMMAKARKVEVVTGEGRFSGPHALSVGERLIRFDKAIIAAGSQAAWRLSCRDDPRIVDSTGALSCRRCPSACCVIGGGIIGMEWPRVTRPRFSRRGGGDAGWPDDGRGQGPGAGLAETERASVRPRPPQTKTTGAEAARDGIHVRFDNADPAVYDLVLVSVGRTPNGKKIGAEAAGVKVGRAGLHPHRQADAHQRPAHLRHRRHRRTAYAGPQGDARRTRRRRGRGRAQGRRSMPARSPPCVHGSGNRLGGRNRGRAEAARGSLWQGGVPLVCERAGRSPTGARTASSSCCSTKRPGGPSGGGIVVIECRRADLGDLPGHRDGSDAEDIGAHDSSASDTGRKHRIGCRGLHGNLYGSSPAAPALIERRPFKAGLAGTGRRIDSKSTGVKPVPVRFRGRPLFVGEQGFCDQPLLSLSRRRRVPHLLSDRVAHALGSIFPGLVATVGAYILLARRTGKQLEA